MKLIALHDKSGKILAAVRHTADYKGPVPVAGKGTTLAKLEIPEAHYKLNLAELCTKLRVDTRSSKLVEAKAKAKSTR
jgi:hypothetical protein